MNCDEVCDDVYIYIHMAHVMNCGELLCLEGALR